MPEGSVNIGTVTRGNGQQATQHLTSRDVQIGDRIRRQRVHLGLSQATMASVLGISEEQLESYEVGRTWIDLVRLFEIAGVLGVDINFFYQDSRSKELQPEPPAPPMLCCAQEASCGWAVPLFGSNSDPAGLQDVMARFCASEIARAVDTIRAFCPVVDPELRGTVLEALKTILENNQPDTASGLQ